MCAGTFVRHRRLPDPSFCSLVALFFFSSGRSRGWGRHLLVPLGTTRGLAGCLMSIRTYLASVILLPISFPGGETVPWRREAAPRILSLREQRG